MLNLPFVLLLTSLLLPEIYIAGKYAPISHFVMIVAIPLLFVKYTAFRGLLIRRFYSFFLLLFFVSIWIIVNSSYLPSPYLTGVVSIVAATGYYMLMPVFNYHNPSNPTRILDAYVKVWIVLIGLNLLMILIAATGLVGSWPEYSQFNRLILTTGNYINFSNMTFGSAMFGTESGTSTSSISTVCALLFIHVFTNRFNDKYAIITLLVLLLEIKRSQFRTESAIRSSLKYRYRDFHSMYDYIPQRHQKIKSGRKSPRLLMQLHTALIDRKLLPNPLRLY